MSLGILGVDGTHQPRDGVRALGVRDRDGAARRHPDEHPHIAPQLVYGYA